MQQRAELLRLLQVACTSVGTGSSVAQISTSVRMRRATWALTVLVCDIVGLGCAAARWASCQVHAEKLATAEVHPTTFIPNYTLHLVPPSQSGLLCSADVCRSPMADAVRGAQVSYWLSMFASAAAAVLATRLCNAVAARQVQRWLPTAI